MSRAISKAKRKVALLEHCVGTIAEIDDQGRPYVRFDGSTAPVLARSVLDATAPLAHSAEALIGTPVLLFFENGDIGLPIIVGLVRDRLRPASAPAEVKLDLGRDRDVLVDGRRLFLDATEEMVLRCGSSTILLRRDGKILIRGTHLVSRSSGPNKIKGGSINLN